MRLSTNGLNLIRQYEALRLTPYRDAGGLWTIGYGHLIKADENFTTIDLYTAEHLLLEDVQIAETAVNTLLKVVVDQNQFDALVSLCYNIGVNAFKDSTMLRLLNNETS